MFIIYKLIFQWLIVAVWAMFLHLWLLLSLLLLLLLWPLPWNLVSWQSQSLFFMFILIFSAGCACTRVPFARPVWQVKVQSLRGHHHNASPSMSRHLSLPPLQVGSYSHSSVWFKDINKEQEASFDRIARGLNLVPHPATYDLSFIHCPGKREMNRSSLVTKD